MPLPCKCAPPVCANYSDSFHEDLEATEPNPEKWDVLSGNWTIVHDPRNNEFQTYPSLLMCDTPGGEIEFIAGLDEVDVPRQIHVQLRPQLQVGGVFPAPAGEADYSILVDYVDSDNYLEIRITHAVSPNSITADVYRVAGGVSTWLYGEPRTTVPGFYNLLYGAYLHARFKTRPRLHVEGTTTPLDRFPVSPRVLVRFNGSSGVVDGFMPRFDCTREQGVAPGCILGVNSEAIAVHRPYTGINCATDNWERYWQPEAGVWCNTEPLATESDNALIVARQRVPRGANLEMGFDVHYPGGPEGQTVRIIFAYLDPDNYQCLEVGSDFSAGCTDTLSRPVGTLICRVIDRSGGAETVLGVWEGSIHGDSAAERFRIWTTPNRVSVGRGIISSYGNPGGPTFSGTGWEFEADIELLPHPYSYGFATTSLGGTGGVRFVPAGSSALLFPSLSSPSAQLFFRPLLNNHDLFDYTTIPHQVQVDIPAGALDYGDDMAPNTTPPPPQAPGDLEGRSYILDAAVPTSGVSGGSWQLIYETSGRLYLFAFIMSVTRYLGQSYLESRLFIRSASCAVTYPEGVPAFFLGTSEVFSGGDGRSDPPLPVSIGEMYDVRDYTVSMRHVADQAWQTRPSVEISML